MKAILNALVIILSEFGAVAVGYTASYLLSLSGVVPPNVVLAVGVVVAITLWLAIHIFMSFSSKK